MKASIADILKEHRRLKQEAEDKKERMYKKQQEGLRNGTEEHEKRGDFRSEQD